MHHSGRRAQSGLEQQAGRKALQTSGRIESNTEECRSVSIDFTNLNIWAILVATVISMVIGALWYSPVLFGNVWMKLVGLKAEELKPSAGPMVGTVIMTLLSNVALAVLIQWTGATTALDGLWIALLISLVLAGKIAVNYIFENRSFKLYWLTIGFHIIPFLLGGIVIAVWH